MNHLLSWRARVLDESDLSSNAKYLLLVLSTYMNDWGDSAFPAISRITKQMGVGRATVYRMLKEVEEKGWLIRHNRHDGGRQLTNNYVAAIPDNVSRRDENGITVRVGGSQSDTQNSPVNSPVNITHPSDESGKVKTSPPYATIRALWMEMLPELPAPIGTDHWTPARKAQIRARWNDQLPDLDTWRLLFSHIRRSKFLMGKVPPPPGRKVFRCDLWWITKPENLLRLQEGKYSG